MKIKNYVSSFLNIPKEVREASNLQVKDDLEKIKRAVVTVANKLSLNNYAIVLFGSVVTEEMIVNSSGEFISDLDIIIVFTPDEEQDHFHIKKILLEKLALIKTKITLEYSTLTFDRFLKIYNRGMILSYRKLFFHSSPNFKEPEQVQECQSNTQVWQNILLLTPPNENNTKVVYRSNIKILKRFIEHLNSDYWKISTKLNYLIEKSLFSEIEKEQIIDFIKKENNQTASKQDAVNLYEFTRDLISKEIDNIESNIKKKDFHEWEVYIYTVYIHIIFNMDANKEEVINYVLEKIQRLPSFEKKLQFNDEDTYYSILNKVTDYFWQIPLFVKSNISIIEFSTKEAKIKFDVSNYNESHQNFSLQHFLETYKGKIIKVEILAETKEFNATKLVTHLAKEKIPIHTSNCSLGPGINNKFWVSSI